MARRQPLWEGAAGSLALHLLLAAAFIWPLAHQADRALEAPLCELIRVDLVKAPPQVFRAEAAAARRPAPAKSARTVAAASRGRSVALGEECVSLEDPGPYKDYLWGIKRKIEQGWELAAGTRGGRLTLIFSVERSGHLSGVRLLSSSGDARLDRSALWAVRHAGPFAPIPAKMNLARLHIKASFCYQLARR